MGRRRFVHRSFGARFQHHCSMAAVKTLTRAIAILPATPATQDPLPSSLAWDETRGYRHIFRSKKYASIFCAIIFHFHTIVCKGFHQWYWEKAHKILQLNSQWDENLLCENNCSRWNRLCKEWFVHATARVDDSRYFRTSIC